MVKLNAVRVIDRTISYAHVPSTQYVTRFTATEKRIKKQFFVTSFAVSFIRRHVHEIALFSKA